MVKGISLKVCENVLVYYGTNLPYHRGKWRIIDNLLRLLPALKNGRRRVMRKGIMWELDLEDLIQRYICFGYYEPWETDYFKRIIKSGDIIIDVGANIGYYSLLGGKLVGANGIVYAFEPEENSFKQLSRHIRINGMDWVNPNQLALGDKIGQLCMTAVLKTNRGVQRVATSKDQGVTKVDVTTLDELESRTNIDHLNLIKVDIEGSEFKFLKGAMNVIY
jgi:FkbM family methyltransferase